MAIDTIFLGVSSVASFLWMVDEDVTLPPVLMFVGVEGRDCVVAIKYRYFRLK
jgi:hypothetical protein